jgi:hypothetical protein
MAQHRLSPVEIEERDQAGQLVATYIADPKNETGNERVYVVVGRFTSKFLSQRGRKLIYFLDSQSVTELYKGVS